MGNASFTYAISETDNTDTDGNAYITRPDDLTYNILFAETDGTSSGVRVGTQMSPFNIEVPETNQNRGEVLALMLVQDFNHNTFFVKSHERVSGNKLSVTFTSARDIPLGINAVYFTVYNQPPGWSQNQNLKLIRFRSTVPGIGVAGSAPLSWNTGLRLADEPDIVVDIDNFEYKYVTLGISGNITDHIPPGGSGTNLTIDNFIGSTKTITYE